MLFWCFILFLISSSESARILGICPTPSISHQIVFHAMVRDLAARGHHLTILTTDLMKTQNPNITQIDLHGAYDSAWKDINQVEMKLNINQKEDRMAKIIKTHSKVLDWELSQPEVKRFIENADQEKFDVVLVELNAQFASLAFGEIFDCPVIEISSMELLSFNFEALGNDNNPVIHPEVFVPFPHVCLDFFQRFKSLAFYLKTKFVYLPLIARLNEDLITRHFPSVNASMADLKSRVKLSMGNTNPALGFIRPLVPKTIQLGFMHIEKPKALPEGELKSFLDNSKNGVIFMSLGSNAQSKDLKPETIRMFLNVFSKLKLDVLWKFEGESLPNKPDRLMTSKWVPQPDVLAHPKLKLFITHGGHQSMEESIDRTVPMVVIPFMIDQGSNAERMKQLRVGSTLDLNTLTEAKLAEAIDEMLKPVYKKNVELLREQVYDQPMTGRERAVWWIEFVIRHNGAEHLDYPGRLIPFYQKYCLDFIGIVVLLAIVAAKIFQFSAKKIVDVAFEKKKNE